MNLKKGGFIQLHTDSDIDPGIDGSLHMYIDRVEDFPYTPSLFWFRFFWWPSLYQGANFYSSKAEWMMNSERLMTFMIYLSNVSLGQGVWIWDGKKQQAAFTQLYLTSNHLKSVSTPRSPLELNYNFFLKKNMTFLWKCGQ